jgi:hypothetical protein
VANTLSNYNPTFYANEALIQLKKALGLAGRVYRAYEVERNAFNRGDTINIRRPGTFTAASAPSGSAQDITPSSVAISLDQFREVTFKVRDDELAFTGQRIIDEHIQPAAYALADELDQFIAAYYWKVPWWKTQESSASILDIVNVRKIMRNNKVPIDDGNLHLMVNGDMEARFLTLEQFTNASTIGSSNTSLMRGSMGQPKFGFEVFANQNVPNHVKGTLTDVAGAIVGTPAKGAVSLDLGSLTDTETIKKGDMFTIAGHTQQYVVTADATVTTTTVTIGCYPGIEAACTGGEVVTFTVGTCDNNLAFHRNWFGLVVAPLPSTQPQTGGAAVAVATDDVSGISLRATQWYVGGEKQNYVSLDILYGGEVLDPNLAVRLRGAVT